MGELRATLAVTAYSHAFPGSTQEDTEASKLSDLPMSTQHSVQLEQRPGRLWAVLSLAIRCSLALQARTAPLGLAP